MNRPAPWGAIITSVAERNPFTVGNATVDPVSREATWPGGSERLQPQTLKVLMALVNRRGEVATRDELVQLCWGGRIVGDDVINRSISILRQFAERAGGFEIETVPRAGYRLVETPTPALPSRHLWAMAAAVAGLVLLVIVGLQLRSSDKPSVAPAPTIALLPFAADSSDPEAAKLASATREAVANTLSQGAYAVSAIDDASHGKQPAADLVISGRLTSTSNAFVATVRMEETAHHIVVFDHQFSVPSTKADGLPDLVSGQVASQISATARLFAIDRRHPSDPQVFASLLQGSQAGLEGAGALHDYLRARPLAAENPGSALAQTDFAFNTAFALNDIPREQRADAVAEARLSADRAAALAPEFGDTSIPWCLLRSEQRMTECENHLRAAMRTDSDAPFVNWFLAIRVLEPAGRESEALELARASLAHDPYMPAKIGLMLRLLEATGQTAEADDLYRKSSHWWPNQPAISWPRMAGMAEGGDFKRLADFASQTEDPEKPDPILLAIGHGSAADIRKLCAAAQDFDSTVCMLALARQNNLDGAFALADRLYPSRRGRTTTDDDRIWLDNPGPNEVSFLTSRAAAPLRHDPRFLALADRTGLLDYWRSGRLPDFCTKVHEPVCAQIGRRAD